MRILIYFSSLIISTILLGQNSDANKLNNEISVLNDAHKYEETIIKLENILTDRKSTHYDKYNAYLQKYITFKRLYNYPEAEANLNLALEEGQKSDQKREVETRIQIEKLFIAFDLLDFAKVEQLLPKIDEKNLPLINDETRAFYLSVIATLGMKKGDYQLAENYFNQAIEVLETDNAKHLPNIYRKKIGLYQLTKNHELALDAFETGLYYAKKYSMDVYILNMYEQITHYYSEIGDYKNAYQNRIIVNELATKYDALNQSGKVLLLEKQLINNRNDIELEYQKTVRIFLYILSSVLIILIIVLYKLFKTNKQKRVLIERENNLIRKELTLITQELNEKGETKVDLDQYNLSERQLEIIQLVKQGKTNKEIGEALFISENTVKYHLKIIYTILAIETRASLK